MTSIIHNLPARRSAAHLIPPRPKPVDAAEPSLASTAKGDRAGIFVRLRGLINDIGPSANRNELVIALIIACIGDGLDTESAIVGTIARLGFNPRHVATILKKSTGSNPEAFWWRRERNGTYTVLEKH